MTAVYPYSAGSSAEAALKEGQHYQVVDQSDADWWKIVDGSRIGIVPAAYLGEGGV